MQHSGHTGVCLPVGKRYRGRDREKGEAGRGILKALCALFFEIRFLCVDLAILECTM